MIMSNLPPNEDDYDDDVHDEVPYMNVGPVLAAGYTPCIMHIELYCLNQHGHGTASLTRRLLWPGTPQKGMCYCQDDAPWHVGGPFPITNVSVNVEEEEERPPPLTVELGTWDLTKVYVLDRRRRGGKHTRSPGRAEFLEAVKAMLAWGWEADDDVMWTPFTMGQREVLDVGQILGGHDEQAG